MGTTTGSTPIAKVTLDVVTAGYSGTAMAKKLGIKEGHRVLLYGAPVGWSIEDLPSNVHVVRRRGQGPYDVVLAFVRDTSSVRQNIHALSALITPDGSLWITWPRRTAGHVSDVTDNVLRDAVLPLGLVDVKVAALDYDWSSLKFVWRKELRER